MPDKTVLEPSLTMPKTLPEHSNFVKGQVKEPIPRKPMDDSFMSLDDRQEYFPQQSGRFSTVRHPLMTDDVIGPSRPGEWSELGLDD